MILSTREQLIELVSARMRLLRNEYNFSQDKMAEVIGISKKTLVQIEKNRVFASWPVVVTICSIFRESEILRMTIGEDPIGVIEAVSFEDVIIPKNLTGGGRVFWKTIESKRQFRVQKHLLTSHYRLIDGNDKRWISTFNEDIIFEKLEELIRRGEEQ